MFLLMMTLFGWFQFFCILLLLTNTDVYLYDFRLTRYLSFGLAMSFDLIYLMFLAKVYDLLFIKAIKEKSDDAYDALSVVVLGYGVVFFAPDFYMNASIVLKELTMS